MTEDVSIPTYQELKYPVLTAIHSLGGSAAVSEIDQTVIQTVGIDERQLAVVFGSGSKASTPKVVDRIRWAVTYLRAAGALENSQRGVWSLTDFGRSLLSISRESAELKLQEADVAYRSALRASRLSKEHPPEDSQDFNEAQQIEDQSTSWESSLLAVLGGMDPIAFERLAMRLLREAGFTNVQVTQRSNDGGIDGVGVYRPSLVSFPIYFQCKRYGGSVGPSTIRDFRGAMAGRGEKGIVITTGTFTPSARLEATRDGAPPVDLIDGDDLCLLLKELSLGVTTTLRTEEDVSIDPSFFASI